jgi:hypothetical protein
MRVGARHDRGIQASPGGAAPVARIAITGAITASCPRSRRWAAVRAASSRRA